MSRHWSPLSQWQIAQVWVLTYWLRVVKQHLCFSCLTWEQHIQLESVAFPVPFAESFCQESWFCLSLSPVPMQAGALPGTLSPPSFLAGCWDWVRPPCLLWLLEAISRAVPFSPVLLAVLKLLPAFKRKFVFHIVSGVFTTYRISS